jgi:hypothetical protein
MLPHVKIDLAEHLAMLPQSMVTSNQAVRFSKASTSFETLHVPCNLDVWYI